MTQLDAIPWAALPVLVPVCTALLLLVVRVRAIGVWIAVGGAAATLAVSGALAWVHPADRPAAFAAPLVGVVGLAIALAMPGWVAREIDGFRLAAAHVPRVLATGQALLAGGILVVLAPDPVVAWVGLVGMSLALFLPLALAREPAVRTRGRALLGLAAMGLVVALVGSVVLPLAAQDADAGWPHLRLLTQRDGALAWLGAACLLLGLGVVGAVALVAGREGATPAGGLSGFAVLLPLLVLATRLPPSVLILGLGVAMLLAGAVLAARVVAVEAWVDAATLVQAGMVVVASGLGTPAAMFAALVQLGMLTLTRVALAPEAAGLLALAGVPPFGVFAGVYLILAAISVLSLPLTAVLGAAVLVPLWRLARVWPPMPEVGWHALACWVLLALGGLLALAMPASLASWIARVAADLP